MVLYPRWVSRRDYYYLKPADVIVERIGDRARAVDKHGNRIAEGTDHYVVFKKAVEETAKKRAGKSLVVYAFNLEGTIPAGNPVKLTKDILGDLGLKLFELHCINCYWRGSWEKGKRWTFLEVHGDIVESLLLNGHNSTTFYDVGQVINIVSSDPSIKTEMLQYTIRNYVAYIHDEYDINGNLWGGFHIGFGNLGPISSDEEFHIDTIVIENVTAYPLPHERDPECLLMFIPRARKIFVRDVHAEQNTGDHSVIETYGFWEGAEMFRITNCRIRGFIGIVGQDVIIEKCIVDGQVYFNGLVSSIDYSTHTIYRRRSRLLITNSDVGRVIFVGGLKNYNPEFDPVNTYTEVTTLSMEIRNSIIRPFYLGINNTGGICSRWISKAPGMDIEEIVITDSTIIPPSTGWWPPLINVRYGTYVKRIIVDNVVFKSLGTDYFNRLLYVSDDDIADEKIDEIYIRNVIFDNVRDYVIVIGSSSSTYTTTVGKLVIDNMYLSVNQNYGIAVRASAQLTRKRVRPSLWTEARSGLTNIGAGATVAFGSISVPSTSKLVIGELHLYDPDGAIKLQIYNVTDATVAKEIGTGSAEDIGWYTFAGGKTYEFRLVNTDTTNAHNANARVVYAQMP